MMLTGQAKLAGVMGWPISHSRSPMLHAYWLNEYGIDAAYLPFSVDPASLEVALRALPALGIAGTNLTVPHKEAALEICDHVDEAARHIGAVNTVVVQSDGSLFGSNTDAFGFIENLKAESSWQANNGPAVILGAGGAARGRDYRPCGPSGQLCIRHEQRARTPAPRHRHMLLQPPSARVRHHEQPAAVQDGEGGREDG